MSDSRFDLPPASAPNFNERVREVLSTYLGRRGDRLDRGITVRDLSEAGLIAVSRGFLVGGGGSPVGGIGGAVPPVYVADLTPPPTPTGFTASAAISNIFIECAAQTYLQGHGHAKTVVYGVTRTTGPLPTFANAVPITEFGGTVFAHPTNPSTTWHLWIKWVTVDGVASASPAGGANGLVVTTGQDVSLLLDALTGEITESELFTSLGNRINLIDGTGPGSVTSRIASEATVRATADGAISSRIDTVIATATTDRGAATAAIQTEATVRATQTGELYAQWTVKLDVGGRVAGIGLANTGGSATPSSAFTVRADRFYIANPAGAGTAVPDSIPFIVQTTPTTIGGVTVPIGVYMTDAFIMNGTITNAKIANLAVDDAKIATLSVSKLTAGSIAVGQYVQSSNYIANTQGWRINGDGTAELAQAVIRGGIYANFGTIGGNNISSDGLTSPGFDGTVGWSINSSGAAYFGNISIRGQINTGSFTGYAWPASGVGSHLSGQGLLLGNLNTGKYFQVEAAGNIYAPGFKIVDGVLTISQANVINTFNIAGNSISRSYNAVGNPSATTGAITTFGRIHITAIFSPSSIVGRTVSVYRDGVLIGANTGTLPLYVIAVVDEPTPGSHTYTADGVSSMNYVTMQLLDIQK